MLNKKNNRGFTLVELLVTIAILGIITGMSIPLVRNIQRQLESRKYETYGKAMLSSAKVYQNDYNEDLFGHHNSGCASVTLNELISKGLIKDFPDSKISCNANNEEEITRVSIVKVGKQYGYSYNLYCGIRGDDSSFKEVHSLNSKRAATCNGGISSVTVDAVNKNFDLSESHSEKIKLTSATGINFKTLSISYAWVEADAVSEDVIKPDIEWEPLAFRNNISESKQKDTIFNKGKSVSMTSEEVTTPKGKAENYVLVLKINSLKNLALDDLEIDNDNLIKPNYKAFGPYKVGQTYKVTFDSNGGSECKPSFVTVLKSKESNPTLANVDLCSTKKDDNMFKEWNTEKDGTGNRIDKDSIITQDTRVYAQWVPNNAPKITFKIQLDNGDNVTQKTTSDSGNIYTWGKNGNILTRKINDGTVSDYTYEIVEGKNVTMDLPNYNNSKYINISKDYSAADGNAAWKCVSGCKKTNQVFSHNSTVIGDTSTMFNSDTVIIKVNWRKTQAILRFKVFTKDYPPYEKLSVAVGGTLNSYGYLVNNSGDVDFQKIPYDGVMSDIYRYGILDHNTIDYVNITRDYHTAVRGEEWKCVSGDCTKNQKYDQVKRDYKATDFCSLSILKERDCIVNLAVNWRLNQVNVRYRIIGGDTIDDTGYDFENSHGYLAKNNSLLVQKANYNSAINLLNYNNLGYVSVKHGNCTKPRSGHEWVDANTKNTFDQNKDYKAQDICSSIKDDDCTVDLRINWLPNKPTLSGAQSSWGNKDYDVTATTTTTNNVILGRLYSKEKNGTFVAGAVGRNTVKATMSTANGSQKNTTWYVRACNTFAKDGNDNANCSDYASTAVKIDKKKPVVKGYGIKATNEGTYGSKLVSSQCSGNKKVTGHCDSEFKVTCFRGSASCNWSWDYQFECDDDGGSGCVKSGNEFWHQIKWDHNGWESRKCKDWTSLSNCQLRLGDTRATWTKLSIRVRDNVGNYSDEFYFQSTCSWCNEVRSVCNT